MLKNTEHPDVLEWIITYRNAPGNMGGTKQQAFEKIAGVDILPEYHKIRKDDE